MRNALAHGYSKVDLKIVWKTIHNDLPELYLLIQSVLVEWTNTGSWIIIDLATKTVLFKMCEFGYWFPGQFAHDSNACGQRFEKVREQAVLSAILRKGFSSNPA